MRPVPLFLCFEVVMDGLEVRFEIAGRMHLARHMVSIAS